MISDPHARYLGAELDESAFLPGKHNDIPTGNLMQGDFCYQFTLATQSLQAYFAMLTNSCLDGAVSPSMARCPVTPACPASFPDMQPDNKFYNEVMSLEALGIVSGYEDACLHSAPGTLFKPDASMARGSALKMLVQAFNISLEAGKVSHFSDVPPGSPYCPYVEAAYQKGLVIGYKDGTFKPEQGITRGSIVKVVVQAAGWELVKPEIPTFTDVGVDSALYPYIETANAYGLLTDVAIA